MCNLRYYLNSIMLLSMKYDICYCLCCRGHFVEKYNTQIAYTDNYVRAFVAISIYVFYFGQLLGLWKVWVQVVFFLWLLFGLNFWVGDEYLELRVLFSLFFLFMQVFHRCFDTGLVIVSFDGLKNWIHFHDECGHQLVFSACEISLYVLFINILN